MVLHFLAWVGGHWGGEKAAVPLPVLDCFTALREDARGRGRVAVAPPPPPRQPWRVKRNNKKGGGTREAES